MGSKTKNTLIVAAMLLASFVTVTTLSNNQASAAGNTVKWSGATCVSDKTKYNDNCKFSIAGNWEGNRVPVTGDTIELNPDAGYPYSDGNSASINNDLGDSVVLDNIIVSKSSKLVAGNYYNVSINNNIIHLKPGAEVEQLEDSGDSYSFSVYAIVKSSGDLTVHTGPNKNSSSTLSIDSVGGNLTIDGLGTFYADQGDKVSGDVIVNGGATYDIDGLV